MPAPPFDAAAKELSRRIAVAAGKPRTSEVGMKAIHAVLHRSCFSSERLAWEHYGVSKQRFYEWKPHASQRPPSIDQAAADTATAATTAAAAEATTAARERKSDLQRECRHGEEAVLQALLSTLIVRLEYSAAREQRAKDRVQRASKLPWRCLGGCTSVTDCARATFRRQCMPTDAAIREHWHPSGILGRSVRP